MKRKIFSISLSFILVFSMLVIMAPLTAFASTTETLPPAVEKSVSPTDINIAGSGGTEETTVTITVTGAGGTSSTITPMDVVFAIDSSGSMQTSDPTDLRKDAATDFLDKLDSARDTAGVVDWDSVVEDTYGLSSDFSAVETHIGLINSSGGTNLNAGLNGAIAMLDANTRTGSSMEVIIFLTDGVGTYTYSGNAGSPADDAASKGYVIYSIGLGTGAATGPLMDMAAATGGTYYNSPSADNLQAIFDEIYEEVVTSTVPYNVDVTEVTQPYIEVVPGSFNVTPDSITTLGSGATKIVWEDIDSIDGTPGMPADETVTLTFQAKSTQCGADLDVQVEGDALVNYEDNEGNPVDSVAIPQAEINVNCPPDTSEASADPGCLWPPNNKLVGISIIGVTDPEGDPFDIIITGITSDEPTATDEGSGGAIHAPDAEGVGTDEASVRAERSGDGDGRVYEISFVATDEYGAQSTGSVLVKVPHDQSTPDCTAVDSGQNYDATQIN